MTNKLMSIFNGNSEKENATIAEIVNFVGLEDGHKEAAQKVPELCFTGKALKIWENYAALASVREDVNDLFILGEAVKLNLLPVNQQLFAYAYNSIEALDTLVEELIEAMQSMHTIEKNELYRLIRKDAQTERLIELYFLAREMVAKAPEDVIELFGEELSNNEKVNKGIFGNPHESLMNAEDVEEALKKWSMQSSRKKPAKKR